MKRIVLAASMAALSFIPATAQTTAPTTAAPPPTVTGTTATDAKSDKPAKPLTGANSFTEAQARGRIEKAGFTGVSPLKKSDDGIWRGTAMRAGAQTPVALDFKGNVFNQ